MLDDTPVNVLKNTILLKVGITTVSPSDCELISASIKNELNRAISVTTLKRLFGFAEVKHQFSQFTINTLLDYVDHIDLKSHNLVVNKYEDWKNITSKCRSISQKTLRTVISNCSIPYNYTTIRESTLRDFEDFYHSDFTFTSIVAQAGYGKSITLSHIAQELFLKSNSKYQTDILIYLNAKSLYKTENNSNDLEIELKKILEIADQIDLATMFTEYFEKTGNKIIIIIDEFSDLFAIYKGKSKIFQNIIHWLCKKEENKAMKLLLGMRSSYWVRFQPLVRNSHYLRNKWYPGKYYSHEKTSNMPMLSKQERNEILYNFHYENVNIIEENIKIKLKYAFQFKYYYLIKSQYNPNKFKTNIILYEIYFRHILDNIYESNCVVEKITLSRKIIKLSNYGKDGFKIDKTFFLDNFRMFDQAYMELINEGIFIENKKIVDGILIETVEFGHKYFFEYFLYEALTNNVKIDEKQILKVFANHETSLAIKLLKWIIFISIRNSNYKLFELILRIDLPFKQDIILFTIESIRHQIEIKPTDSDFFEIEIKNSTFNSLIFC